MHQLGQAIQIVMDGLPRIAEAIVEYTIKEPNMFIIGVFMIIAISIPYIYDYYYGTREEEAYTEAGSGYDDPEYDGLETESEVEEESD